MVGIRRYTRSTAVLFLSVFVLAALVVGSACGDDDDDDQTEPETTEQATEPTEGEEVAEETVGEEAPTEEATAEETATEVTSADFDEEAVAEFYSGKTVTILVGFTAGGGFDLEARLIAEHLGQYIPGNPTVIVENMPGAGSLVAWNHLANAAPSDGTVIGYSNGAQILQQALGNTAVEFDAQEMQYLGTIVQSQFIMVATSASGIESFDQILPPESQEITTGGSAPGSGDVDHAVIMQEALGASINLITGYDGVSPIVLAMDSGEVEGTMVTLNSARSAYADQFANDWTTLVALAAEPFEDLPDVPAILDFATDEFAEQVITAGSIQPQQFNRPLVVASGVPEDRVLALSRALEQMLLDEEFLAFAEGAGTDVDPLSAEELRTIVDNFIETLATSEDVRVRLQELLLSS
ncbi:MAG: hypothetical protein GEU28_02335 [Dehalococcoidia bacterium]|nr:hypothetical protein [Dehalococcoidia bacterium]